MQVYKSEFSMLNGMQMGGDTCVMQLRLDTCVFSHASCTLRGAT